MLFQVDKPKTASEFKEAAPKITLGQWLDSINYTKQDLIAEAEFPADAAKQFPVHPILRIMSNYMDVWPYIVELNLNCLRDNGLTPKLQYEFLLHSIPRKKRYAKLEKPEKEEKIDLIMEVFGYSYRKAKDIADLINDDGLEILRQEIGQGGTS